MRYHEVIMELLLSYYALLWSYHGVIMKLSWSYYAVILRYYELLLCYYALL